MKKGRRDNQCRIATCFCQRNNEMKNNDCLRIHNLIKKLTITLFIIFPMICSAQKKELLIIGTMHTVPNIVKNAYRPLLKYAIDYAPEAIYVEYIQARDTISLKNHTRVNGMAFTLSLAALQTGSQTVGVPQVGLCNFQQSTTQ